jgi:hypothetical protein
MRALRLEKEGDAARCAGSTPPAPAAPRGAARTAQETGNAGCSCNTHSE